MYQQHEPPSLIKLFVFALAVAVVAGIALAFGVMEGGRDLIMAVAESEAWRAETARLQQEWELEAPYRIAELERANALREAQANSNLASIQLQDHFSTIREERWLQFEERAWYLGLFVAFFLAVGLAVTLLYVIARIVYRLSQRIPSAQYRPRPVSIYTNGARRVVATPEGLLARVEVWRPVHLRPHLGNQSSRPLINHEPRYPILDGNYNN